MASLTCSRRSASLQPTARPSREGTGSRASPWPLCPLAAREPFDLVDSFRNADIKADVILSYPSLLKQLLGVIPYQGCLVRKPSPLLFQLLGDGRPSEWVHPDPKERGAQVRDISPVEWCRLMSAYHQSPGQHPAVSRPPPWEPVSPRMPPSSTPPVID